MLNNYFNKNRNIIIFVFCACFIYTSPVLIANRYFIDDLGRSSFGYFGWGSNGRPVADFIMSAIHGFTEYNTDISPMPLIIALVIYSLVSVAYVENLNPNLTNTAKITASLGFIINPFFLENLSYKYDVLPMMASMSVLLLAFLNYRKSFLTFFVGFISVIISLSCYQATIGFFICLSIIEFTSNSYVHRGRKKDLINCYLVGLSRFSQLALGYLIYIKLIQPLFAVSSDAYTAKHSETVSLSSDGFYIAFKNAQIFIDRIVLYVDSVPSWVLTIAMISLAFSYLYISLAIAKQKSLISIVSAAITVISPVLIFAFSIIPLLSLKYPVVDPRVMISFSSLSFIVIGGWVIHNKSSRVMTFISIIYIAFSFTYSFAYGNASQALKKYEDYIASSIASDIKEADPQGKLRVQTIGYMNYPYQSINAISNYPSMRYLLPRYLNNNWYWGYLKLSEFGIRNKRSTMSMEGVSNLKSMHEVVNRGDYEISKNDSFIIVRLNGKW